jgi:hypothetical protein
MKNLTYFLIKTTNKGTQFFTGCYGENLFSKDLSKALKFHDKKDVSKRATIEKCLVYSLYENEIEIFINFQNNIN